MRVGARSRARWRDDRSARSALESSRQKLVDAAQDVALDAVLSMSTVAQQQIFDSEDLRGRRRVLCEARAAFAGR
jgi:hypothetical protein